MAAFLNVARMMTEAESELIPGDIKAGIMYPVVVLTITLFIICVISILLSARYTKDQKTKPAAITGIVTGAIVPVIVVIMLVVLIFYYGFNVMSMYIPMIAFSTMMLGMVCIILWIIMTRKLWTGDEVEKVVE